MERVSIKEYCRINNIGETTVRKLIKAGLLEAVRYGRAYRINVESVPLQPEKKPVYSSSADYLAALKRIPAMRRS